MRRRQVAGGSKRRDSTADGPAGGAIDMPTSSPAGSAASSTADEVETVIAFDVVDGEPVGPWSEPEGGGDGDAEWSDVWFDGGVERWSITPRGGRRGAIACVLAAIAVVAGAGLVASRSEPDSGVAAVTADGFALTTAESPRRLAATGTARWEAAFDGTFAGGLAVGDDVVALHISQPGDGNAGYIVAVDLDSGDEVWRRSIGAGVLPEDLAAGFGAIITNERIPGGTVVTALEETSGEVRWERSLGEFGGIIAVPRTQLLVEVTEGELHLIDPETGERLEDEAGESGFGGFPLGVVLLGGNNDLFVVDVVDDDTVLRRAMPDGDRLRIESVVSLKDREFRQIVALDDGVIVADSSESFFLVPSLDSPADAELLRLPLLGLAEPDEFEVELLFRVGPRNVIAAGAGEVYGFEFTGAEMELRWQVRGAVGDVIPTVGGAVVVIISDSDRGRVSSPARLVDGADGRELAARAELAIVDEFEVLDNGVVQLDLRPGTDRGSVIGHDLFGFEQWRFDGDAVAMEVGDGVVVTVSRNSRREIVVTGLGAV